MIVCSSFGLCYQWILIDGEEQAVKLLKEIIGLWVTIRGFSIAGTWMEQYLHATKGTSKTKGLRKELKRKSVTTKKILTKEVEIHIDININQNAKKGNNTI